MDWREKKEIYDNREEDRLKKNTEIHNEREERIDLTRNK